MANAILRSMIAILTLDKAGRLVLPKAMREKLHLREGAKLRAEVVGDRIEIEQEVPEVKVVRRKGGRRVVVGWTGFDAAKAVREMREEQVERLLAPFKKK